MRPLHRTTGGPQESASSGQQGGSDGLTRQHEIDCHVYSNEIPKLDTRVRFPSPAQRS